MAIDVLDDTSSGVLTIRDYNSYMVLDPIDTLGRAIFPIMSLSWTSLCDMSSKQDSQEHRFEPLPYRVSDHDPVIIGITLPGR